MEAFKIAAQLFLIMSALEKSGPAFLVPGRANRDPTRSFREQEEILGIALPMLSCAARFRAGSWSIFQAISPPEPQDATDKRGVPCHCIGIF
jgi:hypothetical protein